MKEIAEIMSKELGAEVSPEAVVMLPEDGCPGHMGLEHWNVYAARCGEFTILLYEYDDGLIYVSIN